MRRGAQPDHAARRGLFAAAVTWAIYRDRKTPTRKLSIDVVGLASLVTWVASLQIMLDKGKNLDWFSSPVFTVLMAPVVGKILPKSELRVLATLSFLGFAAVYFMRSHYTTGVDTYTRRTSRSHDRTPD